MTEPAQKQMRYQLILGKQRVVQVKLTEHYIEAVIELGNSVFCTTRLPLRADIKEGDLLTFYTEVPIKAPANDQTLPAPIQ